MYRIHVMAIALVIFSGESLAEIVFETDFANDGAYSDSGTSLIRYTNVPEGFDGIRTNQGRIYGVPGAGINGSVALKYEWPATNTALATSLFKHLTGDKNTGYDELYIRYRLRLPDSFRAGSSGNALSYWKWGRLWQNTGLNGDGWTENRDDSYYVVFNWSGGLPIWGTRLGIIAGANTGPNRNLGSAGGPRYGNDYYVSGSDTPGHHTGFPGHWDAVGNGAWEFDHDTRQLFDNNNQEWHTIEYYFKLSSSDTANDGEWKVFFDGVEQVATKSMGGNASGFPLDRPLEPHSLPTAAKPGYNMFVLFDNISGWGRNWDQAGVEGGIYLNDLVISTTRIGHDYDVGDPRPNRPTNFIVE